MAREQLLVGMEEVAEGFPLPEFAAAVSSRDPHERNKVAVIERLFEELVNWVDELAERGLAEGRRLNLVQKSGATPYNQLVEQRVISQSLADRLEEAKDLRDLLQHGYPMGNTEACHQIVSAFPATLDLFLLRYTEWLEELGLM
jgi:hypothetical protein